MAASAQKAAHAKLEEERIRRQIDLKQMSQQAIEMVEATAVVTTEAAAKEHSAKVAEMLARSAHLKRKHEERVKELEIRAERATADLHRLQSNVATMLEETRAACESERLESEESLQSRHREELGRLRCAHREEKSDWTKKN